MDQQKNIILAFALSMIVLVGWGMLFPESEPVPANKTTLPVEQPEVRTTTPAPEPTPKVQAKAPVTENQNMPAQDRKDFLLSKTVSVNNDVLRIQVNEQGRMVTALLPKYRQSLEPDSEPTRVLELGDQHARYVRTDVSGYKGVPTFQVVSRTEKGNAGQLLLKGKLDDGRVWQRTIRLQPGSYVVEVEDRISSGTGLKIFRQVVERNPDKKASTFQQYEGPIGLVDNKLKEPGYDELDKQAIAPLMAKGGWIGIMNRYFIAAFIGEQSRNYKYYFHGDGSTYRAGMLDEGEMDGTDAVFRTRLYIGPKSIPIMKQLGVGLERCVDFGWFAFIAKPLHEVLLWFNKYIPNLGLCIILLVVIIKALFYWPTQKSYESMAGMRKLQPEMARIKELYGDDRQLMGQKTMELYKKHKINPLGGCLPVVIQIPVFFSLYKVLLMSIEMRHAPLGGWIHDLSAQDPYYILPVFMGASMLVQQRLNPQPPDPVQAKVMQFLPIIFTAMFLFFPSGLVLYWLVNNILSIVQQYFVLKSRNAVTT